MKIKEALSSGRSKPVWAFVLVAMIFVASLQPASATSPEVGELGGVLTFLEVMEKYIVLTDLMQSIAADDTRTAGFAVLQVKDLYDDMGKKAEAADVLKEMLKETTNKQIRNLIRLQLADILKNTGRQMEAVDVLREVVRENAR
jgi:thioredoxin-like negative regulator of GroEL